MTLIRNAIPSPNYSNRGGQSVRLIVLHSSEGAQTYTSLGNFFANPSSGVSSHVGIDDTPNTVGEYVRRDYNAWTAANANPVAVQAELCTPSGASMGWTRSQWDQHPQMLSNAAQWIKEEAAAFGIPIVRLTPPQAQGGWRGVCQHSDLGSWGGNHSDCGPNFPIDSVIAMAKGTGSAPAPTEELNMVLGDPLTNGVWVIQEDGAVFSYDGAPYLGGTNNNAMNAQHFPCIGMAAWGDGYVIVLDFGKGTETGLPPGSGDRYRRYHFPRDGSGIVKP